MTEVDGVGAGTELHLKGDAIDGHALVWDDAVIHLSAFPSNGRRFADAGGPDGAPRRWFHSS